MKRQRFFQVLIISQLNWGLALALLLLLITLSYPTYAQTIPLSATGTAQQGLSETLPRQLQLQKSNFITLPLTLTNNLPITVPCEAVMRLHDDSLTTPSSDPIFGEEELCADTQGVAGNKIPAGPDKDNARFIVVLKTLPVAARLDEIQQAQTLTVAQQEAEMKRYSAMLAVEQTAFLDNLQKNGLVQQLGRRFTYLINGIALTARLEDRQAIASLPQVQAVYFDHQAHITLAESVPLIGAPTVWGMRDSSGRLVSGTGVKVAIVDTGIDYTHPDLGGCLGPGCKVAGGYDFVNNDDDPQDDNSHGTHVAGIVGANGTLKGVAPGVTLLAYKVCDASGSCSQSNIIAALERAVTDHVGIVNMSFGGPGSFDDPLSQATNQAVERGVSVIVSAGNNADYRMIGSPGGAARALTVGATTKSDSLYWASSKGPVADYILKPDLVAPGENINSLILNHGYGEKSGTSMAAPHLAGAAALLKQLHPNWTPEMIKASLMNTALLRGYDPYAEGAGRVRVDEAARTTIIIQPASLSLGQISNSQGTWTKKAPLAITNVSTANRTYQLAISASLPGSVSVGLSQNSVALNAGQTKTVTLTVTVNASQLPYPNTQPYAYYGRIVVTSGAEQRHVAFAFVPPPISCQLQTEVPIAECTALEALYYHTGGPNWFSKGGWLTIPPCGWYGVDCEGGHIDDISLRENNLVGNIPAELGNLAHLWQLVLPLNYLSGSIPPALGNLSNLRNLGLSGNQLSGSIPSELGNLTNLELLYLDSNSLSGNIPSSLGNLASLQTLFLRFNQLSGNIPAELGHLDQLQNLLLDHNQLSGNLPPELGNLTSTPIFWLHRNQLSGNIPPELGNLAALRQLLLDNNLLTGAIPPDLANLKNLRMLALEWNWLSGSIPPELGSMANLESLYLASNNLSGPIPPQLGNLANLSTLWLDSNQLSGDIPAELGGLTNLEGLYLAHNQLSGGLPPQLGNLSQLRSLHLDNNALNGEVPQAITQLVGLSNTDIGYNKLIASQPEIITFLNSKDPDWAQTQTTPPANIQAVVYPTPTLTIQLTWSPILYTADGGYYQISYATGPGEPYTVQGITGSKADVSYEASNLPPATTYYFIIQTYTPAHGDQQSDLWSDPSQEIVINNTAPLNPTKLFLPVILKS